MDRSPAGWWVVDVATARGWGAGAADDFAGGGEDGEHAHSMTAIAAIIP
jgi:hypothetical protein